MQGSYYDHKVVSTVDPILGNTTAEGTGVAVAVGGYHSVLMVAQQGISGDTLSGSVYWTIAFQESDTTTAGDFTNIAAGDLKGGVNDHVINAAEEDPTTIIRSYTGKKAYVRILWTQTGTHTNGTPLAGLIILGDPVYFPVTQVTELGG